jgi:hypothetical protein
MTPTPLDAKPQGAQLKRYAQWTDGSIRSADDGDLYYYAEAAERIEKLEREKQLHAGDTITLSNELDEWKGRAQDAERALAEARRDAGRLQSLRNLCGFIEDGSDTTVKILQDDATHSWLVIAGRKQSHGPTLSAAIDAALQPEKDANNG